MNAAAGTSTATAVGTPQALDQFSNFLRQDTHELLSYISSLMNWSVKNPQILDFSCGPGYNTEILHEAVFKHPIYALDSSQSMINYASQNYGDPGIQYIVADIMKDKLDLKFDKIFSTSVIFSDLNQEKILRELFHLLKTKGEIGIYFISSNCMYYAWDTMAKDPKWSIYHKDFKNSIPRCHYRIDPAKDLKQMLETIGYVVQEACNLPRIHTFCNEDSIKESMIAINPFIKNIPVELQNEYITDLWGTFRLQSFNENNSNIIQFPYQLALARAYKEC